MAAAGTHIFRVALRDQPSIHRGIEIDSAKSLAEFAEAIVGAFGFEFDHAFGFYTETEGRAVMRGRPAYELFANMSEATEARSDRVAWVGGVDAMSPTRVSGHAMRTYSGRPRSSMRFRTSAAIATSVAWRPSVCDRSPSPMTRFQRDTSDSTRARRL